MFGYRGQLYQVENDFQIAKVRYHFDAVGCGSNLALGCLFGLVNQKLDPKIRIKKALEAAQEFSAGVREPFHIVSIKGNE